MESNPLIVKAADQAHLISRIRAKLGKPTTPEPRREALRAELQKQCTAWLRSVARLEHPEQGY